MFTTLPSSDTWMWPSSVLIGPVTWGTTLAPISLIWIVTSGPVSWFGVGARIWIRAVVAGRVPAFEVDGLSLPQAVRASTTRNGPRSADLARRPGMRLMGPDDTG